MVKRIGSKGIPQASHALVILFGVLVGGCSAAPTETSIVGGRRVQNATVAAQTVPFQLSAYELVFQDLPSGREHARRAALLVDFVGDRGHVRGFTEWGAPREEPRTYLTGGWARQNRVNGEVVTVFELALNYLQVGGARRTASDPVDTTPLAVRVVVHEGSGEATLTARR